MREIRTSGSEGGGTEPNRSFLPLSGYGARRCCQTQCRLGWVEIAAPRRRQNRAPPIQQSTPAGTAEAPGRSAPAARHPAIGFGQSVHCLRKAGHGRNHKRAHRIYTVLGLSIRHRASKRKRLSLHSAYSSKRQIYRLIDSEGRGFVSGGSLSFLILPIWAVADFRLRFGI